ncbi:succinylglutamate desuccinylase/aspartoacylase family protein [Paenibacillus flagellatus]|nr:M14 family metallopeptidase [Paenibacillus flagellatus]
MAVRMEINRYDMKSRVPGTKRSFELLADVGLDEPLTMPVLQVDGVRDGNTLLVLASVHGDEYEGVETALRLFRDLPPEKLAGTVVLVPAANPLAYRGGARVTPEDGLNMARTFPGNPEGTPTERIAYELHHRFIARSDFLLDLHSGGTHYAVSALVGYYHDDGSDVGRRSRAAAESFGAPLLWAHESVAPGRTVSSALALGVPWLYTEAYGGRRVRRDEAELFYAGALRLMRHLGMLEADDAGKEAGLPPAAAPLRVYGDGNFDGSETAGADGFFLPSAALGTIVRPGDAIGDICGLDGDVRETVRASREGLLVMIAGTPTVRRGEPLFMLAETRSGMTPRETAH